MSQGNSALGPYGSFQTRPAIPRESWPSGGDLSRSRPAHWPEIDRLRHLGTSLRRAKRDVPGPAILRRWERRDYALLRPANGDASAQEVIRDYILEAYTRTEAEV